jgi:signal recognition particle receptor subunit beta
MVFFNYALRKLNAKIVYYGPGLCGKTTNLQWIHDHFEGGQRGRMISLATEGDRTIFFDLLPLDIGSIRGMQVTLQLYTVPGQVHYNSTRQLVLKGADGVVFVADSQRAMLKSNQDSWRNLQENLLLQGVELRGFPHVVQFNKRDLRDIMSMEDLDSFLNQYDCPIFEAVATDGVGVQETLEGIVKLVMRSLKERYEPVVAGTVGPQPAPGVTAGPWPVAGAPSSSRAIPMPPKRPLASPHTGDGATQPLSAEPSGVVTRDLDVPAPASRPPQAPPYDPALRDETDDVPTLVSEEETLDDRDLVVPATAPEVQPEEGDTATGRELFGSEELGSAAPAGGELPDDPTGISSRADDWVYDDGGPEDPGEIKIETWPDHGPGEPETAEDAAEPFTAADPDLPGEADLDVEPLGEDEPFEPDGHRPPEPPWEAEDTPGPFATVSDDQAEPELDLPISEGMTVEPAIADVAPAVGDVDLDALHRGSADESTDEDLESVDFDIAPDVEPKVLASEYRLPPLRPSAEAFFVSDEEPFDDVFDGLVDEPSGAREVTAEASALVSSPVARVGAIDVDPESNQLHVRLHGKGALAEYGQVRELDIVVPVPGQWIGNRRVTLQLRLTLSPMAEGEQEGPDGAS